VNQIHKLMVCLDLIYKVADVPFRIALYVQNRLLRKSKFSTTQKSDSDSTSYTDFVSSVVRNDKKLDKFRKAHSYRMILEHVDFTLGNEYLNRLKPSSITFYLNDSTLKNLSKVGSPRVYYYPQLGWISPTVIRYLYVNQMIEDLFSKKGISKVGEIGVGFGGQFAITSKSFQLTEYSLYDLPVVLALSEKTLGKANLYNGSFKKQAIDPVVSNSYDLVISNYAFSELPAEVQRDYISKIFKNTSCGYLTMNSGRSDVTGRSHGKMSLVEIQEAIPGCEVLEEDPKTGPDNYIIVWGHQNKG
jgi:putative sugar O-methyltransferase